MENNNLLRKVKVNVSEFNEKYRNRVPLKLRNIADFAKLVNKDVLITFFYSPLGKIIIDLEVDY